MLGHAAKQNASAPLAAAALQVAAAVREMIAKPNSMSSIAYNHMQSTTENEMNALCKDFSDILAPCAQVLLPQLLQLIERDPKCCSDVSALSDLLNLVVPEVVHVMQGGRIIHTGGLEVADTLEADGYDGVKALIEAA